MTDLVQWNNCAGCMRKRSLLSEQLSFTHIWLRRDCIWITVATK